MAKEGRYGVGGMELDVANELVATSANRRGRTTQLECPTRVIRK